MDLPVPAKEKKPRKPYVRKTKTATTTSATTTAQPEQLLQQQQPDLRAELNERKQKRKVKFDSECPEKLQVTIFNTPEKKMKLEVPSTPKRPPVKRSIKKESKTKSAKYVTESCSKCDRGQELASAHTVLLSFVNGELISVKQDKSCATTKVVEVGSLESSIPKVEPKTSPIFPLSFTVSDSTVKEAFKTTELQTCTDDWLDSRVGPTLDSEKNNSQYISEVQQQGTSGSTVTTVKPSATVETMCEKCGLDTELFGTCLCVK
jgi:hypothetical protein